MFNNNSLLLPEIEIENTKKENLRYNKFKFQRTIGELI